VTGSMQRALEEMTRRRELQRQHNDRHGITPRSIVKSVDQVRFATRVADAKTTKAAAPALHRPADVPEREALVRSLEHQMQGAATPRWARAGPARWCTSTRPPPRRCITWAATGSRPPTKPATSGSTT